MPSPPSSRLFSRKATQFIFVASALTLGLDPGDRDIQFLLRELRTPELLVELASNFPQVAGPFARSREAIARAINGDVDRVRLLLAEEEAEEKRRDREYWRPLRRELEQLRHARRNQPSGL